MGRRLLGFGVLLIAVTVALWVAETAAWIPASTDDRLSPLTLKAGLLALAAGVVLRLLTPIAAVASKDRCSVCGHATERGRTYCLDHLQATVNETRDESHHRMMSRPKIKRSPAK